MDNIISTQPIECKQESLSLDELTKIMKEDINKKDKLREELKSGILKTGRDSAVLLIEVIDEIDPSVIIQHEAKKFSERFHKSMRCSLSDEKLEETPQSNYLGRMSMRDGWINL